MHRLLTIELIGHDAHAMVICVCLQGSVSLVVTLSMGWRSASRARWVTSSPGLAPGSVSSVPTKPRRSPEERWTRWSVEVIQSDGRPFLNLKSFDHA